MHTADSVSDPSRSTATRFSHLQSSRNGPRRSGPQPDHYVFPACERNEIDPSKPQKSWRSAWRSLTKEAGFPGFRFHDLRHQAITEMAEAGASDATIMAAAGHIDRAMMEHYSHVRMAAKRDVLTKLESGLMEIPVALHRQKNGPTSQPKKPQ